MSLLQSTPTLLSVPSGGEVTHEDGQSNLPNGWRVAERSVLIPAPSPATPNTCISPALATAVTFLYLVMSGLATGVTLTLVHEHVPPPNVSPPLPDILLSSGQRLSWAFSVCETNGLVLASLCLLHCLLLRQRQVILRRFMFLAGTLYLYRCITMAATILPVPGLHFQCAPKLGNDVAGRVRRAFRLLAGGGMTLTGAHNLCGDYLYSGHTMVLTLCYLFCSQYCPSGVWSRPYLIICWLLSTSGIICILLAHDHYTVDVIVAYYITTRLFWAYHTLAVLPTLAPSLPLYRPWWGCLLRFLEAGAPYPLTPELCPLKWSWGTPRLPLPRFPRWPRGRGAGYNRLQQV
uniref:Sphingomyelin synthase 1a n=1 Tax=Eptatretus burgeri TaxID=7764 RepID=A0A8C4N9R8_EPTBU